MESALKNGSALTLSVDRFATCRTISDVLDIVLEGATKIGLYNVRYYHYAIGDDAAVDPIGELVSVESVGHTDDVAGRLRTGAMIFLRSQSEPSQSDSFWCIENRTPIVVEVDRGGAHPTESEEENGLWHVKVVKDRFTLPDLPEPPRNRRWLDVPLSIAGIAVGKLSCDIARGQVIDGPPLDAFWRLANSAAPYLEYLRNRNIPDELDNKIRRDVHSLSTLGDLYEYCTVTLPTDYFDCKYASLFTVAEDSFGSQKLVLRKTSYPGCQPYENIGYYELDEEALTASVWKHKRAVRMHDLDNQATFNAQSLEYGGLQQKNKFRDSDNHKSFLAMPIAPGSDKVIGVLRFSQKEQDGRDLQFDERDQRLLQRAVDECIAPELNRLANADFKAAAAKYLDDVNMISVRESAGLTDVPQAFCNILTSCCGKPKSKKFYVINLIEPEGGAFRHHAIGGNLAFKSDWSIVYPLAGTLTDDAIHSDEPVVKNGLTAQDTVKQITPDAVSAVVSKVAFDDHVFGAIAVLSDRYDLLGDTDGRLIQLLAKQLAAILARRKALAFLSSAMGQRHDCLAVVGSAVGLVHGKRVLAGNYLSTVGTLLSFLGCAIAGYSRPGPPDPKTVKFETDEFSVLELIETAACAARVEVSDNCGIEYDIRPDGLKVTAHRPFLALIVHNLIKNAWQNSDAKKARPVHVTARRVKTWLQVQVKDNGKGMSNDDRHKFIDWDIVDAHRMSVTGRGTGLTLARTFAGWHKLPDGRKGSLELEHTNPAHESDDRGSCFVILIPTVVSILIVEEPWDKGKAWEDIARKKGCNVRRVCRPSVRGLTRLLAKSHFDGMFIATSDVRVGVRSVMVSRWSEVWSRLIGTAGHVITTAETGEVPGPDGSGRAASSQKVFDRFLATILNDDK